LAALQPCSLLQGWQVTAGPRAGRWRTLAARRLPLALAALGLTSCGAERHAGLLPTVVSVVTRMEPRGYLSLLVDLNAPRQRPTLRVAPGLVAYDGQNLVEVQPIARIDEDLGPTWELLVSDLQSGDERLLPVARGAEVHGGLEVVHLLERSVVMRNQAADGSSQWREVDLSGGGQKTLAEAEGTSRFECYGPDRGFTIYLDGQRLMLALPHGNSEEALPLLDQVAGVVSVNWVAESMFPTFVDQALDGRFKMAGSLQAMARESTVDGDLREWAQDVALGVGSAAHVQEGLEAWDNERDASFAVAARLAPYELCAAIRVRDDDLLPGQDIIEVETNLERWQLEVPAEPTELSVRGLHAAFTDQASFGVGVELCLHPQVWETRDGHVPFRVIYRDVDEDEGVTIIASAPDIPWPALAGVRLPRRGREGTLPHRDE